jgi:hypothetical protein
MVLRRGRSRHRDRRSRRHLRLAGDSVNAVTRQLILAVLGGLLRLVIAVVIVMAIAALALWAYEQ